MWAGNLTIEDRAANTTTLELGLKESCEVKLDCDKAFVQVTSKEIPAKYQVCMTSDAEGSSILSAFNPS